MRQEPTATLSFSLVSLQKCWTREKKRAQGRPDNDLSVYYYILACRYEMLGRICAVQNLSRENLSYRRSCRTPHSSHAKLCPRGEMSHACHMIKIGKIYFNRICIMKEVGIGYLFEVLKIWCVCACACVLFFGFAPTHPSTHSPT